MVRRPDRTWLLAHLTTLVIGAVVLLWVDREQWFAGDEWHVVTSNGLGSNPMRESVFAPHFEHWSTLGILVYKALYGVFALRSYWPYIVVLVVVILALAHVSWRLLLRIGVTPAYSTAVAALTMVLAVGWENRSLAWQITIIGPVALGFAALLAMPEHGRWHRRDLTTSALLVVSIMCSGVGITMTVVVTVAALLRRGWRVALAIVTPPAVVYGIWYLVDGTSGQRNTVALSKALEQLPDFAWRGLTGALSGLTRVSGTAAGAVVLIALAAWLVWRARPRQEPWPLVLATAIGALVSISLTGVRRGGVQPDASRYSDIVVLLALPALALATQELGRALIRRFGRFALTGCAVAVIAFLVIQVVSLEREVRATPFLGEMRPRVLATAKLMRDGEPIASSNIFGIFYLGEPSTTTIARLDRNGELPAIEVSADDLLTARQYVGAVIGDASAYPEGVARVVDVPSGSATAGRSADCVTLTGDPTEGTTLALQFPAAGSVRVSSDDAGTATMAFEDGPRRGRPRSFTLGQRGSGIGVARDAQVRLRLPGARSTVCGLASPAPGTSS